MKVLHVISSGGMYGAEAVILNLSRCLNQGGDISEIAVFENHPRPNYDLQHTAAAAGIAVHLVPCRGQFDRHVPSRLRAIVRSTGADVVHAHGYKADLYCWAALRRSHTPLVSTCHTWYDNSRLLYLYGAIDRAVLRSFAAVIAVSADVRERLLAAGVPRDRTSLIANGVETRPFADARRQRLPGPHPGLTVGLVGRLSQEKGIDLFLHAAARIAQQHPAARFHIIGDGAERTALEQLAQSLGLADRVLFLGRQTGMPAIYASLNLLVSSSRHEGLPIALLEAMASGLPIVATAVGEVPSLIRDGETGLLVPAADVTALSSAMDSLLASPSRRAFLGDNAAAFVEANFSAAQMTRNYRGIYSDVLTPLTNSRQQTA